MQKIAPKKENEQKPEKKRKYISIEAKKEKFNSMNCLLYRPHSIKGFFTRSQNKMKKKKIGENAENIEKIKKKKREMKFPKKEKKII